MTEEYKPDSYDAVLSRMDAKLDGIMVDLKEIKENHKTLEKRISVLENFKYYLMGIVAIITIGAEYLFNRFKS
jgi:hypothetical protein